MISSLVHQCFQALATMTLICEQPKHPEFTVIMEAFAPQASHEDYVKAFETLPRIKELYKDPIAGKDTRRFIRLIEQSTYGQDGPLRQSLLEVRQ